MIPTEHEFARRTKAALTSLWGSGGFPSSPVALSATDARLSSVVRVEGRLSGKVVVTCSRRLARQLARLLFPEAGLIPSDGHVHEAVREAALRVATELTRAFEPSQVVAASPATDSNRINMPRRPLLVFDLGGEPCCVLVDVATRSLRPTVHLSAVDFPPVVEHGRRFERVPVDLAVTVSADNRRLPMLHASDLSFAGIFVESETHLPRGTDCDVIVHRDSKEVHMAGRVARTTSRGFAVEFLDVGEESCGYLEAWVKGASTPRLSRAER